MRNLMLSITLILPLLAALTSASADEAAQDTPQAPAVEAGAFDHAHAAFTAVLAARVDGDRVDYAALKEDRAGLDAYTASLEAIGADEFQAWTREERYAFWINAYNAYTLEIVIDHYPLASIRDIERDGKEVWDIDFVALGHLAPTLGKERISLNDVEHRILRKEFEDARVHAAVNCASRGCPPLAAAAFDAEQLDEQLTAQARAWIADPARNRVVQEKSCLELSRIFEWFESDFVRDAGSVQAWVEKFAPDETARWLASVEKVKVRYLDYSWDLNDVE